MCESCKYYTRQDVDNVFAKMGIRDQDRFVYNEKDICTNIARVKMFSIIALAHYLASKQIGYITTNFDLQKVYDYISMNTDYSPLDNIGNSLSDYALFDGEQERETGENRNIFKNNYSKVYSPNLFALLLESVDYDNWKIDNETLPNRISKFIYDRTGLSFPTSGRFNGIKYPDNFFSLYSNYLKNFYIDNLNLFILIDKNFDWSDGDFGDTNSCIFNEEGCNRHQLPIIKSSCMAIKIYNMVGDIPGSGIGRALLAHDSEGNLLLFNGYGQQPLNGTSRDNSVISIISRLLASHYHLEITKSGINSDGRIFINMSTGFVLSKDKTNSDYIRYIFRYPVSLPGFNCHYCNKDVGEEPHIIRGHNFCSACVDQYLSKV
jgi:hypothetical protein